MTTETPAGYSEANVFLRNPAGVKVHFKLTSDDPNKLVKNVDTLVSNRIDQGWRADEMERSPGNGGGGGSAPAPEGSGPASKYKGPLYGECPDCSGAVYDNRQKKDKTPSWKGPWFKCRDEDCGWAVFKTDGTKGR